jgi:hypothetical protein
LLHQVGDLFELPVKLRCQKVNGTQMPYCFFKRYMNILCFEAQNQSSFAVALHII